MSILNWLLKEGDEVEIYSFIGKKHKMIKIQRGPFYDIYDKDLWIIFEGFRCAYFKENSQQWIGFW